MPKFIVKISVIDTRELEIEAETDNDAYDLAWGMTSDEVKKRGQPFMLDTEVKSVKEK